MSPRLSAAKIDEPVGDPLGLKEVDLRVYQKTLVEDDTSGVVVSYIVVRCLRALSDESGVVHAV